MGQLFLLLPDVVVHPMDADSPLRHITSSRQLKVIPPSNNLMKALKL